MDSLTHIALGACAGDAFLGKKLGKRAMLLGAIANSIPDIDFVASFWLSPASNLLAHRGFTHSFLFTVLVTPFLALLAERIHRPHNISLKKWMWFFGILILLHLLIDSLNAYGTGWFEPFSHYRVSCNVIFVADPFYSVWLGIAFIALLILNKKSGARKFWVIFGIGLSSAYLIYCITNKYFIDKAVKTQLAKQNISYTNYLTTPTPLNNWLWYVVASNKDGYNIGYISVFDKNPNIAFHFFPRNDSLLKPVSDHVDLQHLLRFSQGYYTAEKWGDTLVFNDLRFGQVGGWYDQQSHFVFHYFLQHPETSNNLVIQRGRFENWNTSTLRSFIERIKGN